jgi:uncharacterized delta-60 repeat protein
MAAYGTFAPEFAAGGKLTADLGSSNERAFAVARDGAGNLYLAGSSDSSGYPRRHFAVLKVDAQGNPVGVFGSAGKTIVDMNALYGAQAIARDAAGNLYVAGTADGSGDSDFTLLKLDASGQRVAGFGTSGTVTVDLGASDHCGMVALDAQGNIYLVGSSSGNLGVVKLDASGKRVAAYGSGGIATVPLYDPAVFYNGSFDAAALDAAGRIVATTNAQVTTLGARAVSVMRIGASGQLDASFGDHGRSNVFVDLGAPTSSIEPTGIVLDRRGNIFVGGDTGSSIGDGLVVIKFDANGNLVPSYGSSGIATVADTAAVQFGNATTIDGAGNVYVVGYDSSETTLVAEFNATGHPAVNFGTNGVQSIAFGSFFASVAPLQSGVRLYLAGWTINATATINRFAAVALTTDPQGDVIFRDGFEP